MVLNYCYYVFAMKRAELRETEARPSRPQRLKVDGENLLGSSRRHIAGAKIRTRSPLTGGRLSTLP